MKKFKLGIIFLACALFITACSCSKKFTVEFDSNGGTRVESQTVSKGETATKPKNPTREGYTFNGWYLDLETKEEYDFDTEVTEDIILTAKWTKKDNSKKDDTKTENDNSAETSSTTENTTSSRNTAQSNNSTSNNSGTGTVEEPKEDEISYKIEDVADSAVGQVKVFIIKNGIKTSGKADITTTSGTTKTVTITESGYMTNKGSIKSVDNIKLK